MAAPYPVVVPKAFALNADPSRRNVIPDTTGSTQRASWDIGYPPLTMTPVVAGGKPMLGPDMNGVLYMLSTHTFYQQAGMAYRWNADVVVAIGGYAPGTILGSTDNVTLWFNLTPNNASDPDAGGAGWVPMYSYGITTLPPSNGGILTLTPAQASKSVIVISGVLAANLQVVLPNSLRRWLIVNTTSGAFTTTVKTAAGSGVQIPQGGFTGPVEVYGDGTNIYNVVAPTTIPGDVAPTPNTFALRSNNGYLYATYFNQSSALENFTINEVYAGIGDGFLRKINRANFAANFLLSQFAGQLANAQVTQANVTQHAAAVLANAALTGTPTTPTAGAGTSTTQVASTAFVQNALADLSGAANTVIKFGAVAYGGGSNAINVPFVFGSAFPNACTALVAMTQGGNTFCQLLTKNAAGATVTVTQRESGGGFGAGTFMYIAIGN